MELIIEIILEIFGELIATLLAKAISTITNHFDNNKKSRMILKNIFSFLLLACVLGLLIFSFISKKGLYLKITLSYMIILCLLYASEFINNNFYKKEKFNKILSVMLYSIHLLFPLFLIIFSFVYMDLALASTIWVIVLSFIGIGFYVIYGCYKIHQRKIERKIVDIDFSMPIEYNQTILKAYYQDLPIYFTKYGPYDGPVTMQYLPNGGIQSFFGGNLIIKVENGFMKVNKLVYKNKRYSSKKFIQVYPDLLNEVLEDKKRD